MRQLKKKDIILALLVIILWGANFTVIKLGLNGVPSMLLVALRYIFTAFPAIFFIKRPKLEWKYIILYGFIVGVAQFTCLFYAIEIGMPASLASVIGQSQAFLTPIFNTILLKEKMNKKQIIGSIIAAFGLIFIGKAAGNNGISSIPLFALVLNILAAVFWSLSNILIKYLSNRASSEDEEINMLSLVIWGSLIPPIPMIIFALILDSPQTLIGSITNMNGISIFAVLYLAYGATLFGYGIWSNLMAKYPVGTVAPLSLLVPITGLITAQIVLSEKLLTMQWIGGLIILVGLIITNIDFKELKKKISPKV